MSEPEQLRKARMSFDLANRCRFAVSGIVAPIMQDLKRGLKLPLQ